MRLPFFQLDAFASRRFGGNPAAVVVLPDWLPDATLQAIALENNLSETAFLVPLPATAGCDFEGATNFVLPRVIAVTRWPIRIESGSSALNCLCRSGLWSNRST